MTGAAVIAPMLLTRPEAASRKRREIAGTDTSPVTRGWQVWIADVQTAGIKASIAEAITAVILDHDSPAAAGAARAPPFATPPRSHPKPFARCAARSLRGAPPCYLIPELVLPFVIAGSHYAGT